MPANEACVVTCQLLTCRRIKITFFLNGQSAVPPGYLKKKKNGWDATLTFGTHFPESVQKTLKNTGFSSLARGLTVI